MNGEVFIRPLTVEDAAVSVNWRNDAEIWKYAGRKPDRVITSEMEREWAANVIADKSRLNFAICLNPSKRYIGNIYIKGVSGRFGGVAVFIGEKGCWGRGYGRAALRLLLAEAARRGFRELEISVHKDNVAAIITYLKCGAKMPSSWQGDWIIMKFDISGD